MMNINTNYELNTNVLPEPKIKELFGLVRCVPFGYENWGYRLLIPKTWGKQTVFEQQAFKPGSLVRWGGYADPNIRDNKTLISVYLMYIPYSIQLDDWLEWYRDQVIGTLINVKISENSRVLDGLIEVPSIEDKYLSRIRVMRDFETLYIIIGSCRESEYNSKVSLIETAVVSFEPLHFNDIDAELIDPYNDINSGVGFDYPSSWTISQTATESDRKISLILSLDSDEGFLSHIRIDGKKLGVNNPFDIPKYFNLIVDELSKQGLIIESLSSIEENITGWQESFSLARNDTIVLSVNISIKQFGDKLISIICVAANWEQNPLSWMRAQNAYNLIRDSIRLT